MATANDVTKANNGLIKEVSKLIKDDLANAGLHLLELKKGISMVQSDTFVTDTALKIKEEYTKASKDTNAPSTFKKYAMRWGRLVSPEKRNEIKLLLSDVSNINELSMTEIDTLLSGVTQNRGGGRKSSATDGGEVSRETKEVASDVKDTPSTPSVESVESTPSVEKAPTEVISISKCKKDILNSLSNLLTLDADAVAFKISKLTPSELQDLAKALALLS